ncbi:MAG: ATP-grasp domain-containing protein [Candidatus Omnitrophica bacterium]|jgi:D-alanine-D-alanine ligase|nr:ATP-grasp domain-containing protein [Candidatus Omnitrophota bacterium]MDD3274394.1 ATP-grasp domain-containing protein [Candidatus Omnitrophota bacterium]MDD5077439.1 ATP-grasp domain-containing protein [Candidatus Omnitrophota bacterium]MDD5724875.1 ATP-grasp domain-containing protein [Candidatus Omnitrophota bacterium]
MRVALTYNLKKKDPLKPADYFSECDSEETINSVAAALRTKGHSVEAIDLEYPALFSYFRQNRVDMVFNIAEGKHGRFRESEVPALLDYLNIPHTGSNMFSLALALNKTLTKKILKAENIPTPNFQLFVKGNEILDPGLKFPLIVKPNCEGSAKGINKTNVVDNPEDLKLRVKKCIDLYQQEALVEEFIEGKELTVGILENGKTRVLPILEIDFSNCKQSGEYFYSWKMKEFQGNRELGLVPEFHCPARLDKETEEKVKDVALRTHRAVGCLDISRTDIRLNKFNVPYVLEINPLPGLDPKESNFPLMAYAAGMKYEDLIEAILLSASERKRLN